MSEVGDERMRRWRMVLGGGEGEGTGERLAGRDLAVDGALGQLYDAPRQGGLGSSAPGVARWLGDIRTYFPAPVVRVLQRDALDRRGLRQMLLEPELLAAVTPDVRLVGDLLALKDVLPARTRETARAVVRQVTDELARRLEGPLRQAVTGALSRAVRNRRPRLKEVHWDRTIRANLRHYQPRLRTVIPETLIGFGRRRSHLEDVIVCLDQSGSMAPSVVHASVAACVLASLPALRMRLVAFDTAVVDLTDSLHDPVEVLFGVQLGGGTDIARALAYAEGLVDRPAATVLVLVSDLFEGGDRKRMIRRVAALVAAGVHVIVLLALGDDGTPAYDHDNASALAELGAPVFACTPRDFPELMGAALQRRDLTAWAGARGLAPARRR